jgi:biopolymer transport protein ExbD/biopolymer transport protein TolR
MAMDLAGSPGKKGRARPEMNVTPLVDVVLVLLIIFMVITPLLAKQFWVHMPDKPDEQQAQPTPPDPTDGPIVVTVGDDGEIRINRDVVSRAEFQSKLRRVLAARRARKVFFDADDDAQFGQAAEVLDLARGGGAATIAVLTDPIAQGGS